MLHIVIVGLVAGFIARILMPGPNNPSGFLLTCALGVAGAFLATFVGQQFGFYAVDRVGSNDSGASYIGATIGAVAILFIWNIVARRRGI